MPSLVGLEFPFAKSGKLIGAGISNTISSPTLT